MVPLRIELAGALEGIARAHQGEYPKEYVEDETAKFTYIIRRAIANAETVDVVLTAALLRGYHPLTTGELNHEKR